ncbi:hypothetical protein, partial [Brevibacterium daeguense]
PRHPKNTQPAEPADTGSAGPANAQVHPGRQLLSVKGRRINEEWHSRPSRNSEPLEKIERCPVAGTQHRVPRKVEDAMLKDETEFEPTVQVDELSRVGCRLFSLN